MTNYEHLRSLAAYDVATAILNVGDEPCQYCPREREERCNDDCDNGLTEWLMQEYDPESPAWKEP